MSLYRTHRRTELRRQGAGFEETCRLEDFDWSASITLDRRLLDAVFSLEFLDKHEHVLLVGSAGVRKSFLAQALGYSAIRAGHTVRFSHADDFFKTVAQARVDNSTDRSFRSPDLLILETWDCTGSPPNSPLTSTSAYSTAIGHPASSSPATGPWTNGSACLTIQSWATVPWTA